MSSSGLIYAVIVGAWAAYLVPMWLRRQDELNEARPTERFSTAIRLLAGRSAMERRASRVLGDDVRDDVREERSTDDPTGDDPGADGRSGDEPSDDGRPDDGRLQGDRPDDDRPGSDRTDGERPAPDDRAVPGVPAGRTTPPAHEGHAPRSVERASERAAERPSERRLGAERRARLLARRRRMVTVLFLAFALGAIAAAVLGLAFLWAPAVPAALLTLYIGHLRKLERQRFEVKLDRDRAAQAAERLRQRENRRAEAGRSDAGRQEQGRQEQGRQESGRREPGRPDQGRHDAARADAARPEEARAEDTRPERAAASPRETPYDAAHAADRGRPHLRIAADPAPHDVRPATAASALVEATDHEEWVDGIRERGAAGPDSWEPVPVPLPTYVTAPVAPRVTRGLDLGAPGTWTAGRPAEPRSTPLFDQYAEPPAAAPAEDGYDTRPRAANE
ncbi:gephyrin-like molybdotransferase receptor GlpR [Kitasatospora indigofera]|uniref:divisome protein SepX/GlpR n=1 Tax=Kitasatospora indigofera TaxID=67307 RepID=UPI003675F804